MAGISPDKIDACHNNLINNDIIISGMPIINCLLNSFANIMKKITITSILTIFLFLNIAAASAVDVYVGESVKIRGSCTSDYVYLFVTGPNLPSNGGNPEDIFEEVITGDSSSFVRVSAFNNGWSYTWDTKSSGGNPDVGTYVFYAVERPVGMHDLGGVDYSTKIVKLLDPSISVSGVSSSKDNVEYSISSENQKETESFTDLKTKEPTTVPTTVSATAKITETVTEIPATPVAGIPPVVLIVSLVVSFALILVKGNKSGK